MPHRYPCNECGIGFSTKDGLARHSREHIPPEPSMPRSSFPKPLVMTFAGAVSQSLPRTAPSSPCSDKTTSPLSTMDHSSDHAETFFRKCRICSLRMKPLSGIATFTSSEPWCSCDDDFPSMGYGQEPMRRIDAGNQADASARGAIDADALERLWAKLCGSEKSGGDSKSKGFAFVCKVCFEEKKDVSSLRCGHLFCTE